MGDLEPSIPTVLKKENPASFFSIFLKSGGFVLFVFLFGFFLSRFFGWVAFEKHDTQELFNEVLDGRTEVKRMAAVEWARLLQETDPNSKEAAALRPSKDQVQSLAPEFVRSAECRGRDVALMSSTATILGYAADAPGAVQSLESFLSALKPEDCPEARIMSVVSLARLGAWRSEDMSFYLSAAESPDPSVRKVAAFALGQRPDSNESVRVLADERLKSLLSDPVEDVRWNAAIGISKPGRSEGVLVLRDLLERAKANSGGLETSLFSVYREAFRAAARTGDPGLLSALKEISLNHPNLKLREEAKKILRKP